MQLIIRNMYERLLQFTCMLLCKYIIAISCHLYDNTLSRLKYDIRVIILLFGIGKTACLVNIIFFLNLFIQIYR